MPWRQVAGGLQGVLQVMQQRRHPKAVLLLVPHVLLRVRLQG
jgi:hypothetical protein